MVNKTIRTGIFEISTINSYALYLVRPKLDKKFKVTSPRWDSNIKVVLPMLANENEESIFNTGDFIRIKVESLTKNEVAEYLKDDD